LRVIAVVVLASALLAVLGAGAYLASLGRVERFVLRGEALPLSPGTVRECLSIRMHSRALVGGRHASLFLVERTGRDGYSLPSALVGDSAGELRLVDGCFTAGRGVWHDTYRAIVACCPDAPPESLVLAFARASWPGEWQRLEWATVPDSAGVGTWAVASKATGDTLVARRSGTTWHVSFLPPEMVRL
jgi:hypothetical protein